MRETPVARYARRILRDPYVLTYFHRGTGNWVLATWLSRSGGVVVEHGVAEGLYPTPEAWGKALDTIRSSRSADTLTFMREMKEALWLSDHRENYKAQEDADYHCDVREFLRKRASMHWQDHPGWCML